MLKPNKLFWIFFGGATVIIAIAIGFAFVYPSYFLAHKYDTNTRLGDLVRALKELEAADYRAAMADTYGGKTPEETLQMYIAAVEKGDNELASKYFIGQNQQKELEMSRGATIGATNKYLDILKKLGNCEYGEDKQSCFMRADLPGPDYFARFKKYPNGIWKIIEI